MLLKIGQRLRASERKAELARTFPSGSKLDAKIARIGVEFCVKSMPEIW